jgi:hypothetical protein
VDDRTIDAFDLLGRVLMAAAIGVLILGILGAILIAGSESSVPGLDEVQRENRGALSVGALAGGIVAAGVLAGLGAILRMLVAERRERMTSGSQERGLPPRA